MIRALAKGTALLAFGRIPGGPALYRKLTREWMGTQASHVTKLQRVVPGYVTAWRELCGFEPEGKNLWIHEAGWTPFWGFAAFLLAGRGAALTNSEASLSDRYLARAVNGVLGCKWSAPISDERRAQVEALRWATSARDALARVGATLSEDVRPGCIPLPEASQDLVHTGGAMEHLRLPEADEFIAECRRVLRPGGIASHVFDHRDHLYHFDTRWPFLAHQAWPGVIYGAAFGHPLLFHNRLLPADVVGRFEAAGFEKVAVRRLVLPAGEYVPDNQVLQVGQPGLPGLVQRLRRLAPLDLRTAAAHYLFRRRS